MVPAFIISTIVGAAIGLRFKVQVLILGLIVATLASLAVTAALGQSAWSIIATTALTAVGIQVGYLCGSFAAYAAPSAPERTSADHNSDAHALRRPVQQSHQAFK